MSIKQQLIEKLNSFNSNQIIQRGLDEYWRTTAHDMALFTDKFPKGKIYLYLIEDDYVYAKCVYELDTVANPEKYKHPIYVIFNKDIVGIDMIKGKMSYSLIKHNKRTEFVDNLVSSQLIPETLERMKKSLYNILDDTPETFYLDMVPISDGYNLLNLPSSCMKGKGDYFKELDTLGSMYIMMSNKKIDILARCIVWNKGVLFEDENTPIDQLYHDRSYYLNGEYRSKFEELLKAEGIEELPYSDIPLKGLYLQTNFNYDDDGNLPWMDSFNILDPSNGRAYFYDWKTYGYATKDLNEIKQDTEDPEKYYVLLSTDGYSRSLLEEDEEDDEDETIYSDYYNSDIDRNDAVWSNFHDSYIYNEDAAWSSIEEDYFADDSCGDGWYYDYMTGEPVLVDNTDFVEYNEGNGEWFMIRKDFVVDDDIQDRTIRKEKAIQVHSLGVYIYNDYILSEYKDYFTSHFGDGDIDEFIEIYKDMGATEDDCKQLQDEYDRFAKAYSA